MDRHSNNIGHSSSTGNNNNPKQSEIMLMWCSVLHSCHSAAHTSVESATRHKRFVVFNRAKRLQAAATAGTSRRQQHRDGSNIETAAAATTTIALAGTRRARVINKSKNNSTNTCQSRNRETINSLLCPAKNVQGTTVAACCMLLLLLHGCNCY